MSFLAEISRENAQAEDSSLREKLALMRARLFAQQLEFVDDGSLRKAVLCPRRAGKTYAFCVWLLEPVMLYDNALCAYISLTMGMAKRMIWQHLKRIDTEFQLGAVFNNTELTMTLPTGSRLFLGGALTADEIDKYRGIALDRVVIDESAAFIGSIIDELIEEVIAPCLWDRNGAITIGGTPGAVLDGSFYRATSDGAFMISPERHAESRPYAERDLEKWAGVSFRWSSHAWATSDNVAMPQIWKNALAAHKASGQSDQDPKWIREGLGRWIADDSYLVYKVDTERNNWVPDAASSSPFGLPGDHEWVYIAGVDLGYDDDFDIEVFAYSDTCDTFYHVYGWQSPGLSIAEIADKIREVESMFGEFEIIVGDRAGLGKTIFASLADTYGVFIEPAEKQDKRDHIALLNSDLLAGRCKILSRSVLDYQMRTVQWDEHKRREAKGIPNHACDATVYLSRWARHHFSRSRTSEAEPGSAEYNAKIDEMQYQAAIEARRRRLTSEWHERIELDNVPDLGILGVEGWLQ